MDTSTKKSVHSIDHFALRVPGLDEAERFFSTFGLQVERSAHELQLRAGDGHRWGRILEGPSKSLAYISFNCFEGDLTDIERQARDAGANFDVDSPFKTDAGFWFQDLDGNLVQVKVGPRTMPERKPAFVVDHAEADERGARTRSTAAPVVPRRLSHVLFFTPGVPAAVAFYSDALGLRLSDQSPEIIAFMHAPHGCDHHLLAFAKSTAKGWHHCAWDVARLDEVGVGASRMQAAGYRKGWGTGRHVLGSNYFYYVQDPWGSFCEYSADIDYLSAGHPWQSGDFPPEDSLYLWGPDVPEDFIFNTEAPVLSAG